MKKIRCRREDYTEAELPRTRRDVFKDLYREQFSMIFRIGLLSVVLLLPILLVLIMKDTYVLTEASKLGETIEADALRSVMRVADMRYGLLMLIAVTVCAALFSAVVRVVRQLVWREPIFFGDDLRNGLRNDAGRFALAGFFLSLVFYLISLMDGSGVTYVLYGVCVVLIIPVVVWVLLQTVYYRIGLLAAVRNGLLHYLQTLPATLLLVAVTTVPFLLVTLFVGNLIVKYVLLLLLGLFGIAPLTMVWLLYALHHFDHTINREQYPQIWRRGLYTPEEDEVSAAQEDEQEPFDTEDETEEAP